MKKNQQYYKSKKRVLKYRQVDTDKVIQTIQIATATIISAMQIAQQLATPIPKFPSGGIVRENAPELFKSN